MALSPEQEKEALKYDIETLKKHIDKRRVNIKIFEDAIDKEREGILTDQRMIDFLEARK